MRRPAEFAIYQRSKSAHKLPVHTNTLVTSDHCREVKSEQLGWKINLGAGFMAVAKSYPKRGLTPF
jgi:hypothetical protein